MKKSATDKLEILDMGLKARAGLGEALGLERGQSLANLAIDKIVSNPDQPRRHRSAVKLDELINSVRERGVLQPIRVREIRTNAEYQIVAGERRWRAAIAAGLKEIPAVIVRDYGAAQAYIDSLVENVVREDLNAIDRAEALVRLKVHLGALSWDEVVNSAMVGISRRQIFHLLGLTTLPDGIKVDIQTGVMNEKHGRALRLLHEQPEAMESLRREIKEQELSGDQAIERAQAIRKGRADSHPHTFKVVYRSKVELIVSLEAKLRELRETEP